MLTQDGFVARSQAKHAGFYDYSKAKYRGSGEKVTIVCPTHGEFDQLASSHLFGNGCTDCAIVRRKTSLTTWDTENFVARARMVHGDLYLYERANCRGYSNKVTITCREHGDFKQTPNNHIYGKSGCPSCAETRRLISVTSLDTGKFTDRSVEINGDRYTYERTQYRGTNAKLTITCREHGDFEQTPNNHLYSKAGCPGCGGEVRVAKTRLTHDEFVAASRSIHGDRYDYSQVKYANAMTKVTIICPDHGPFDQAPNGHMAGRRCFECFNDSRRLTLEVFKSRSAELFDGKYDYSEIEGPWVATRDRVKVVCPNHGVFEVVSGEHLRGSSCSKCSASFQERIIREALDAAGIEHVEQWGHPTLRHKGPLRFDFMIPGIKTLIEYDGYYHFNAVVWSGQTKDDALQALESSRLRDSIKDKWASDNGWLLIRLSGPRTIISDLKKLGILPSSSTQESDKA